MIPAIPTRPTIIVAYTLLDCSECNWRVYEEPGKDTWDGICPRCGCPFWRFAGSRVATQPGEVAAIVEEAMTTARDRQTGD